MVMDIGTCPSLLGRGVGVRVRRKPAAKICRKFAGLASIAPSPGASRHPLPTGEELCAAEILRGDGEAHYAK